MRFKILVLFLAMLILGGTFAAAYWWYQNVNAPEDAVVGFEPNKIAVAMMKAFLAVRGTQGAASSSVRETVEALTQIVVKALLRSRPNGGTFHIEDVQDHVELALMRGSHHDVARAYVLYRERHAQERARQQQEQQAPKAPPTLHVLDNGQKVPLDMAAMRERIQGACAGLSADVKPEPIVAETLRNLYDGVPLEEVHKASILAARTLIEKDPDYTYATARLLLHTIAKEVLGTEVTQAGLAQAYPAYFPQFIQKGIANELLDERLAQFDLIRSCCCRGGWSRAGWRARRSSPRSSPRRRRPSMRLPPRCSPRRCPRSRRRACMSRLNRRIRPNRASWRRAR